MPQHALLFLLQQAKMVNPNPNLGVSRKVLNDYGRSVVNVNMRENDMKLKSTVPHSKVGDKERNDLWGK